MNIRKMLSLLIALAMMFSVMVNTPMTAYAEETAQTTTMYATTNVNVRAGDSTSYNKIGSLTKGQAIASTGKTATGWCIVDYNGQTGYVSGKYLTDGAPAPVQTTTKAVSTVSSSGYGGTLTILGEERTPSQTTPNGFPVYPQYVGFECPWGDTILNAIDASGVTAEMTAMERCTTIKNYLCNTLTPSDTGDVNEHFSPNCLEIGKGCCQGYANAFRHLCLAVGVECGTIAGTTSSGVPHGWNYVVIDGVKYYCDICWEDSRPGQYFMSTTPFTDHIPAVEYQEQ